MKALSIQQPFTSLILDGQKTIETRRWATRHRGDLLICVGYTTHDGYCLLEKQEWECLALLWRWFHEGRKVHLGKALCVVELYDVRPMVYADEEAACCGGYEGAWSWLLRDVRSIVPFEVRGIPGLFEVEDSLIQFQNHAAA